MFNLQSRFVQTIASLLWLFGLIFGTGCIAKLSHTASVTEFETDTNASVEVTQPDLSKLPIPSPLTAKEKAAALNQAATEREPPPGGDG